MDKFNDYINEEIRPNSHVEFEEDWAYNTFTVGIFCHTPYSMVQSVEEQVSWIFDDNLWIIFHISS